MKIKANAKVNLSLDITGKRPDGYHTLCSVFQSVSLCDVLDVSLSDSISVNCSVPSLSGESNLCHKAAKLFFEAADINSGAEIFVEKHIPEAAGLGGGSADAAATLVALNKLCGQPLTQERLLGIALKLGADVPFCMVGGTRLCEGIGEIMTELPPLPECFIVIAKKGQKGSTGQMYNALDNNPNLLKPDTAAVINGLKKGELCEVFKGAYNCFETVNDGSVLNEAKAVAEKHQAIFVGLSGAGPSVILVFEQKSDAETAAKALDECGFLSFVTLPEGEGTKIIE